MTILGGPLKLKKINIFHPENANATPKSLGKGNHSYFFYNFKQNHNFFPKLNKNKKKLFKIYEWLGGAVAQSVERATRSEEVPGSIPAVAARSLLVGSVSV